MSHHSVGTYCEGYILCNTDCHCLLQVTHSLAAAVQLKAQGFIHAAGEGPGMHLAFVQDFPDHILRTSLRRHDAVPWLKDINLG